MTLAFNAANHIAGPAKITYDSQTWYTAGDIEVDIPEQLWDVVTSRYGTIDRRIASVPVARISFKPDGTVTSGTMAKAFPWIHTDIGKSIFSAADKALVIQTVAGKSYTFHKAGLSKCPDLYLAATKSAFDGTIEFIAIHKTNTDVTSADSFVTIATTAWTDTTFDQTKVISPGFTAAWGAGDYATMESVDGFKISEPISVQELRVDRVGIIDFYLTSIGPASCRFTPAGLTEALWEGLVNIEGSSIKLPGVSGSSGTIDLVLTGTGLTITLPKANCVASKLGFGTNRERLGEVMFINRPLFTSGVPAALLTITVS